MAANTGRALEIFTEALRLPAEARAAYLVQACAGDEVLRRSIEALLQSSDRAGDFLERPAATTGEARARGAAVEKPGDRIDRYVLLQQIGEGGCGVVFVAEQQTPVLRRVALKVVKPGMDTKTVIARFEAERQALALMDHPNIAHVFDAGVTDKGRPYFVMELVDGVEITEYCQQHCLAITARLNLFIRVCDAIQHAHQKGIIHRDIKPSNLLVKTGLDGTSELKVIDFGIAKAIAGQPLTDKTVVTGYAIPIGTPAYMSPEQAALTNTDLDTRTDIYSLGVVLYELLTCATPFDTRELLKAGFDEVRRVIREKEPIRPSRRLSQMLESNLVDNSKHYGAKAPKLIREMRGDLDWIVMRALEKDRRRRYPTANALAMDVGRYLSGEAILARPPSASYKLGKLVARNKLVSAAVILTFFFLVISLITTSRWLTVEKKAREDMRQEAELARLEGLGWSLLYQRRESEAEEPFRQALVLRRKMHKLETTPTILFRAAALIVLSRQRFDKIRSFFSEFMDPALISRKDYQELVDFAVTTLARHGRWSDADAMAEDLRKLDPTNSSPYHMRAPLLVVQNDVEGYRSLCAEIISRFSNATDPAVADRMAKDCLILPSSGVNLKSVEALADRAVSADAKSVSVPYSRCCKGLVEFRLGNYEESVKWAQLAAKNSFPLAQAQAAAITAMSQFQLHQIEKSRAALTVCNKLFDEKLPKLEQGELGDDWRDWIIARALRDEAKRMLDAVPPPVAAPATPPH